MLKLSSYLVIILFWNSVAGFDIFDSIQLYTSSILSSNISDKCKTGIKWLIDGTQERDLIAFKMIDAMAKIPSDILSGHIMEFGDFDECMEIKRNMYNNNIINGKYCLVRFKTDKNTTKNLMEFIHQHDTRIQQYALRNVDYVLQLFSAGIGICIPDSCEARDINTIIPVDFANVIEDSCTIAGQETNIPESWDGKVTMIFLSTILIFVILFTIYDIGTSYFATSARRHDFVIAFSAVNNLKKLLSTKKGEHVDCICGIISIAMMFVILGHTYGYSILFPKTNSGKIIEFVLTLENMIILESHLHVDTFLVVGGILSTYTYLEARKRGISFNIPLYYLHRFLRFVPVLLISIMVYKDLFHYLGSGPMWPLHDREMSTACENEWWKPLTFMQNYIFDHNQTFHCCTESWYLALDMQMRLLSPLVLIPMSLWPKVTLCSMAVLTGFGIMIQMLMIYMHNLTNFGWIFLGTEESKQFIRDYLYPTHTRYPSYLIGMIAGYFIHQQTSAKRKMQHSKMAFMISWAIITIGFYLCIYSGHETYVERNVILSAVTSLKRSAWSILIVLLINACILNPEGIANKFLSAPIFKVLSRLSLSMYLTHIIIITANVYSSKTLEEFNKITVLKNFCFYYIQTLLVSIIVTLTVESPTRYFEKLLIGKRLIKDDEKKLDEPQKEEC